VCSARSEPRKTIRAPEYRAPIPDLLGYLQRETELTRPTLAENPA